MPRLRSRVRASSSARNGIDPKGPNLRGGLAERRGNGLQIRLHGFKSRTHLERHNSKQHPGAIGAAVARFLDTEEVTGSNPVSPTSSEQPLTAVSASGVVAFSGPKSRRSLAESGTSRDAGEQQLGTRCQERPATRRRTRGGVAHVLAITSRARNASAGWVVEMSTHRCCASPSLPGALGSPARHPPSRRGGRSVFRRGFLCAAPVAPGLPRSGHRPLGQAAVAQRGYRHLTNCDDMIASRWTRPRLRPIAMASSQVLPPAPGAAPLLVPAQVCERAGRGTEVQRSGRPRAPSRAVERVGSVRVVPFPVTPEPSAPDPTEHRRLRLITAHEHTWRLLCVEYDVGLEVRQYECESCADVRFS